MARLTDKEVEVLIPLTRFATVGAGFGFHGFSSPFFAQLALAALSAHSLEVGSRHESTVIFDVTVLPTVGWIWLRSEVINYTKIGSSGRTRTYNPPVNSRMLCH